MWRRKRFTVGLIAAILILSLSLGGVALAQGNDEDSESQTLLGRVAEILGIDQQVVEDAFSQAQTEMREEALDNYLQNLIDEGVITEEQASEYKEWLQSRPDMSDYMDKLKEWFESKPDMPDEFRSRGFDGSLGTGGIQGSGGFRGMGGMRGFGGLNISTN